MLLRLAHRRRRRVALAVGLVAAAVLAAAPGVASAQDAMDELIVLDRKFRAIQVSQTRTVTQASGPGLRSQTQATTFLKRRQGRVRMRTEAVTQTLVAGQQQPVETRTTVVADGENLWIEVQRGGQYNVSRSPQPTDTGSDLFGFIDMAGEHKARFLEDEAWEGAACSAILVETPGPGFAKLVVDKVNGVLYRVQTKLPDGTLSDTIIEAFDSTVSPADSQFVYTPPEGAAVRELAEAPSMAASKARGVALTQAPAPKAGTATTANAAPPAAANTGAGQ